MDSSDPTSPSSASSPSAAALPPAPSTAVPAPHHHNPARVPAIIITLAIAVTVILSVWYLVWPEPLMIQGEADATRTDMAARVDGRIAAIPVERGQDVAAGVKLIAIDNPELIAKLAAAKADKVVADAELARIDAGTRVEEIAVKKAAVDSANAALVLAQQTYQRTKTLAASGTSPLQRLDETTASLEVANRSADQARLAYQEAVAGFTKEDREIAVANVAKAQASVGTLQALVDQMVVTAPSAGQVYQINTEEGEFVAPGVPLLELVDLKDMWFRFELREDLMQGVKLGGRFDIRVPALGDRKVTVEIKLIASRGEYSGWRSTRATGDFDLRTFDIRAYPVESIPDLRPGMSAYADWRGVSH